MLWLFGLLVLIAKSLVAWLLVLFVPCLRLKYTRDLLELALAECATGTGAASDDLSASVTPAEKQRFLSSLRTDVVFALVVLRSTPNVSPLVLAGIVREMWAASQHTFEMRSAPVVPLYPTSSDHTLSDAGIGARRAYEMADERETFVPLTQAGDVNA